MNNYDNRTPNTLSDQPKKVLIIAYYWPPAGGSGIQRTVKFVKYLREFGWEPIIYTTENGDYPVVDESFNEDVPPGVKVIRTPIKEPYRLYKKFTGKKSNQKLSSSILVKEKKQQTLAEKISLWIRGNLFIPDARKLWIKPSVTFLSQYLKENPVDVVYTTAPPHSMSFIGMGLQQKLAIPWVADFRDPWTVIEYYKDLMLTSHADKKHKALEKSVIEKADAVINAGYGMHRFYDAIHKRPIDVITNGYDQADEIERPPLDTKFSVAHIGTLFGQGNLDGFVRAIRQLIQENEAFKNAFVLRIIGKCSIDIKDDIEKAGLTRFVEFKGYIPHEEAIMEQRKTQNLLLVASRYDGIQYMPAPGKLYEYILAKRPVLCIGPPEGDAAIIVRKTQCGDAFAWDNTEEIKKCLLKRFELFQKNALHVNPINIEQFSRKNLTAKLAEVFDRTLKEKKERTPKK